MIRDSMFLTEVAQLRQYISEGESLAAVSPCFPDVENAALKATYDAIVAEADQKETSGKKKKSEESE